MVTGFKNYKRLADLGYPTINRQFKWNTLHPKQNMNHSTESKPDYATKDIKTLSREIKLFINMHVNRPLDKLNFSNIQKFIQKFKNFPDILSNQKQRNFDNSSHLK